MRSKKTLQKITFFIISRLSNINKYWCVQIWAFSPKMYAQNPCDAYVFCRIIETRYIEPPKCYRKPTDILVSSILCIALIPHYGDSSDAILGVRSVALLQVPKPTGNLVPFLAKSSKKSSISLLVLKKHLKNLRNSRKSATFAPAYYRCICKCDRCAL